MSPRVVDGRSVYGESEIKTDSRRQAGEPKKHIPIISTGALGPVFNLGLGIRNRFKRFTGVWSKFELSERGIGDRGFIDELATSDALPAFLHFSIELTVKFFALAVLSFPFLQRATTRKGKPVVHVATVEVPEGR